MYSKHGFQTKVWGPAAWLFLHCITFNYDPSRNKKETKLFFEMLAHVLPCGACRHNYQHTIAHSSGGTLRLTDSVFESRESLAFWLFKLHNYVTCCQTDGTPTYKDTKRDFYKVVRFYETLRAKCSPVNDVKKHRGGCTVPLKNGMRMRSIIRIKPLSKTRS
jgi:hypothetical protein